MASILSISPGKNVNAGLATPYKTQLPTQVDLIKTAALLKTRQQEAAMKARAEQVKLNQEWMKNALSVNYDGLNAEQISYLTEQTNQLLNKYAVVNSRGLLASNVPELATDKNRLYGLTSIYKSQNKDGTAAQQSINTNKDLYMNAEETKVNLAEYVRKKYGSTTNMQGNNPYSTALNDPDFQVDNMNRTNRVKKFTNVWDEAQKQQEIKKASFGSDYTAFWLESSSTNPRAFMMDKSTGEPKIINGWGGKVFQLTPQYIEDLKKGDPVLWEVLKRDAEKINAENPEGPEITPADLANYHATLAFNEGKKITNLSVKTNPQESQAGRTEREKLERQYKAYKELASDFLRGGDRYSQDLGNIIKGVNIVNEKDNNRIKLTFSDTAFDLLKQWGSSLKGSELDKETGGNPTLDQIDDALSKKLKKLTTPPVYIQYDPKDIDSKLNAYTQVFELAQLNQSSKIKWEDIMSFRRRFLKELSKDIWGNTPSPAHTGGKEGVHLFNP